MNRAVGSTQVIDDSRIIGNGLLRLLSEFTVDDNCSVSELKRAIADMNRSVSVHNHNTIYYTKDQLDKIVGDLGVEIDTIDFPQYASQGVAYRVNVSNGAKGWIATNLLLQSYDNLTLFDERSKALALRTFLGLSIEINSQNIDRPGSFSVTSFGVEKFTVNRDGVVTHSDAVDPGDSATLRQVMGAIVQTITNGDTTHSPSGDAVFDALALKSPTSHVHALGNGTTSGFSVNDYTSVEKTKLAGLSNYVHPTTAGNKHIPTGGAAGQILRYSASGTAVWGVVAWSELSGVPSTFTPATHTHDDRYYTETEMNASLALKEDKSEKGAANGYAELVGGFIPVSRIPASLLGGVRYQGVWNAATNSPTLPTSTDSTTKGYYYKVSVAGTWNSVDYQIGDWVISNGATWDKVDNTDSVSSVAGRTGAITLTKADVGLANVDNTSDLNKPISTATQTALNNKSDTSHIHDDRYYTETEINALLANTWVASSINLNAYPTTNWYPVAIYNSNSLLSDKVRFLLRSPSAGVTAAFNQNHIDFVGISNGWLDTRVDYTFDLNFYANAERTISWLCIPTQTGSGFVVYLRGGLTYAINTNSTVLYTGDSVTQGNSVYNVSVGGVDPVNTNVTFVNDIKTLGIGHHSNLANFNLSLTARALETSRNITLSGDATGTASFDGTADANISVTVEDNSHKHTPANITTDAANRFVTDVEKSAWNSKADGSLLNRLNVATEIPAATLPNVSTPAQPGDPVWKDGWSIYEGVTGWVDRVYGFKYGGADHLQLGFASTADGALQYRHNVVDAWGAIRTVWDNVNFDPASKSDITHTHSSVTATSLGMFANITDLTSAPISITDTAVTKDTYGYIPYLRGMDRTNNYGYRHHVNIGSYHGSNNWAGNAFYIAQGGNDAYPTNAFYLRYDGDITHSAGHTFWHSLNFDPTTKADKSHSSATSDYGVANNGVYGHVKPSLGIPAMDGLGSASISGNYSSGIYSCYDHRHPSDTNKQTLHAILTNLSDSVKYQVSATGRLGLHVDTDYVTGFAGTDWITAGAVFQNSHYADNMAQSGNANASILASQCGLIFTAQLTANRTVTWDGRDMKIGRVYHICYKRGSGGAGTGDPLFATSIIPWTFWRAGTSTQITGMSGAGSPNAEMVIKLVCVAGNKVIVSVLS